ncbi:nuclear transcription factor Y subunit gamma-like isoform X2 [Cloeon dipterum]|uniref:nuclear transcription factor Y subunit gamma-like isoform X2 n=1 Tax=Cloeon dipterum TaxID=197152 RepID=UPI00321FD779
MSLFYAVAADENEDNPGAVAGEVSSQTTLNNFWPKIVEEVKRQTLDLKQQALPLARIKKIMKLDDDVKMISSEAPVLFAKAAEIFILELTLRAWVHTEDNKRRTLQRNDIAMAITKYDQFDFLIDIVPRDDIKPAKRADESVRTSMNADQVQYYLQLAQQHQQVLQQSSQPAATATTTTTQQQAGQTQNIQVTTQQAQPQIIQLQAPSVQNQSQAATQGGIQIVQQIVTPTGEIQQIPIQLTPSQLATIKMQFQSNASQPVIIQTAPIAVNAQTSPQIIQVRSPSTQ